MIIFGWGFRTIKNFGPAFKNLCSHCNNEQYWNLSRVMTWFTLFFIPVFPYEIKYHLLCPVCKWGIELNQKQINDIKPIAEANQLLIDGKISQDEYKIRLAQPNTASSKTADINATENEIKKENIVDFEYCSDCGTKLSRQAKFCGNCGTAKVSI